MLGALIVGTLLAVAALAYVLYPVFFATRPIVRRNRPARAPDANERPGVVALREIEFDRATGKLSDADYATLRERYLPAALAELRAAPDGGAADEIDAAVRAYRDTHRECVNCGPRPETDAIYCSNCGSYLDRRCRACRHEITVAGARFCPDCGDRLAA